MAATTEGKQMRDFIDTTPIPSTVDKDDDLRAYVSYIGDVWIRQGPGRSLQQGSNTVRVDATQIAPLMKFLQAQVDKTVREHMQKNIEDYNNGVHPPE